MSDDLERACRAVVRECLGVREDEEVLVICNPATIGLGERLRGEAGRAGGDGILAVIAERETHGTEPPRAVAAAMSVADVVLAPTVQSLSHTAARKAATDAGVRIATLPGATEEMLARVMSADMPALRGRSRTVAARLTAGAEARIASGDGAELRLDLEGREAISDDGTLAERGAFGNLPCGEGFISPRGGEGRLVVDGAIGGLGIPERPIELTVEDGHLTGASGAEGEALLAMLRSAGEDGTNVAELGVGTNESAVATGNLLEDEKILGTVHVAFGASAGIGGTVQVPVHIDVVVMKPDLEIDGEPLLRDGKLLV